MFSKNNIQIVDSVTDWQASIKIASLPLLEQKIITNTYVNNMIENIKKMGFYIILTDNVAMPHARPEQGVNKNGVSLLKLNNFVYYGEQKIYLIFILAAIDSNSHIDTLKKLMDVFDNENTIKKLINSKTTDEILKILEGE